MSAEHVHSCTREAALWRFLRRLRLELASQPRDAAMNIIRFVNLALIAITLFFGMNSMRINMRVSAIKQENQRLELAYGPVSYPDKNKFYIRRIPCKRENCILWRIHVPAPKRRFSMFLELFRSGSGQGGNLDPGDQLWCIELIQKDNKLIAAKRLKNMTGFSLTLLNDSDFELGNAQWLALGENDTEEINFPNVIELFRLTHSDKVCGRLLISGQPLQQMMSEVRKQ